MTRWPLVVVGLLLTSCAGLSYRRSPRVYAQDSVSHACVTNPVYCPTVVGVAAEGGSTAQAMATGAMLATVVAAEVLDLATQEKVEDALKECADMARSEVLQRRLGGRSPTKRECQSFVPGTTITLAMQLGELMHSVAFRCVEDKLKQQIPGRYSIEQRYRYDPQSGTTTVVTKEEDIAIRRGGRPSDFSGTLAPDVVIHKGDPRYVQAIYDFKFRCENDDALPTWREYESGPFQGINQGSLYKQALGKTPRFVVPRLGVL
jgi:hypothetical protein